MSRALRQQPRLWPTPLEGADMGERSCETCGGELSGRQTKYCTPRCKWTADNERSRPQRAEYRARNAERRSEWMRENRHRYKGKYESDRAFDKRRNKKRARRRAKVNKLERARKGTAGRSPWVAGACCICGTPFVSRIRSKTCTPQCSSARRRRDSGKDWYRHRSVVFERDSWVCQLCGEPVEPQAAVPHPTAPTLDHIIPRSRGGSHDPDNLQTAHFLCNSKKGDQLDYQAS